MRASFPVREPMSPPRRTGKHVAIKGLLKKMSGSEIIIYNCKVVNVLNGNIYTTLPLFPAPVAPAPVAVLLKADSPRLCLPLVSPTSTQLLPQQSGIVHLAHAAVSWHACVLIREDTVSAL